MLVQRVGGAKHMNRIKTLLTPKKHRDILKKSRDSCEDWGSSKDDSCVIVFTKPSLTVVNTNSLKKTKISHFINYFFIAILQESSMKENAQVPIQYYHRPIPMTVESKPLSGMTIVISTYTDLERDFVQSLANLLGANCKKLFAKKETPLLVCPLPEGSKYEGALKWKFPIVTSKYLVDCAQYGQKLSYDDYLVGNSVRDFPDSTLKGTPKPALKTPNIEPTASTAELELNTADFSNLTPTTTNEFTPLRNKRVSELAGPKRKSLSTESPISSPHTPASGSYKCYDAFENIEDFLADIQDENERDCLRECILEMKENQTPEIERIKRMACTPVNRRLSLPKGEYSLTFSKFDLCSNSVA